MSSACRFPSRPVLALAIISLAANASAKSPQGSPERTRAFVQTALAAIEDPGRAVLAVRVENSWPASKMRALEHPITVLDQIKIFRSNAGVYYVPLFVRDFRGTASPELTTGRSYFVVVEAGLGGPTSVTDSLPISDDRVRYGEILAELLAAARVRSRFGWDWLDLRTNSDSSGIRTALPEGAVDPAAFGFTKEALTAHARAGLCLAVVQYSLGESVGFRRDRHARVLHQIFGPPLPAEPFWIDSREFEVGLDALAARMPEPYKPALITSGWHYLTLLDPSGKAPSERGRILLTGPNDCCLRTVRGWLAIGGNLDPDAGASSRPARRPTVATLRHDPDPAIVTGEDTRRRILATTLPWRVKDDATGIVMVLIPPGSFMRGAQKGDSYSSISEKPRHEVRISKSFYVGVREVTSGEFAGASESKPLSDLPATPDWGLASEFCSQHGFRLPTEAEWEYMARAGVVTRFPWGDDPGAGRGFANVFDAPTRARLNEKVGVDWLEMAWSAFPFDDGYYDVAPVGSFSANAFGVHDVIGNVWEFCSDRYVETEYRRHREGAVDPECTWPGDDHVMRGGSYLSPPSEARLSSRASTNTDQHRGPTGFRVVREASVREEKR